MAQRVAGEQGAALQIQAAARGMLVRGAPARTGGGMDQMERRRGRLHASLAGRRRAREQAVGRRLRTVARASAAAGRDQSAVRLLAFWAAASKQVEAAQRVQCWVRRRQLSARLARRRRQFETARLGGEILAQLASAHEARLAAAAGGGDSREEQDRSKRDCSYRTLSAWRTHVCGPQWSCEG